MQPDVRGNLALQPASLPIKLRNADDIARLVAERRPTVDTESVLLAVYLRDAEWANAMKSFIGLAVQPTHMPRKPTKPQEKK
jgi:hypothetical protein